MPGIQQMEFRRKEEVIHMVTGNGNENAKYCTTFFNKNQYKIKYVKLH